MADSRELLVTVRTIEAYRDSEKNCICEVGDEHDVTKERADKLIKAKKAEIVVKKPAKENNTEK